MLRLETPGYEGLDKKSFTYLIGKYAHIDQIGYVRGLFQEKIEESKKKIEESKEKNSQGFGVIFHIYMRTDGVRIEADAFGVIEAAESFSRGEDSYIRCLYIGELYNKDAILFLNEPRDPALLMSQKNILCESDRDRDEFMFNEFVTLAHFLIQENTMHPDTEIKYPSSLDKIFVTLTLEKRKPQPKTLGELDSHYHDLFYVKTKRISFTKIKRYHQPRARIGFAIYLYLETRKILEGLTNAIEKRDQKELDDLIDKLATFVADLEKIKSVILAKYDSRPLLDFEKSCRAIEDLEDSKSLLFKRTQEAKLEVVRELRTTVREVLHRSIVNMRNALTEKDFGEIGKIIEKIKKDITEFNNKLGINEEMFANDVRKTGSSPLVIRLYGSSVYGADGRRLVGCMVGFNGRQYTPYNYMQQPGDDRKRRFFAKKRSP